MKQLTVMGPDKLGLLADISYILGRSKINIETVSAASAGGRAFIIMGLSNTERAAALLKANHYEVMEADVLVVKLEDKPGELGRVSQMLTDAGVAIQNVSILAKGPGVVFDAIQVDKVETARRVLKDYLDIEK
ncbi:ACT domain protein [uncultured archaeon]|nr:ACT domain protein [uncultured archaeon]